MLAKHNKLSLQIVISMVLVFGVGLASLILVGANAIRMADKSALSRQERIAKRNLADAIAAIPEQQRSATVWDDAVEHVAARDERWMDENLGTWMQDYFGHQENYVINPAGDAMFASALGKVQPPETYSNRAVLIAPIVARLREIIAEASSGRGKSHAALANVAAIRPLRLDDRVAIASVVPIISDSRENMQAPGTENLHVAIRYIDEKFAQEIGLPIELRNVAFKDIQPTGTLASVPLTGLSGEVLSWLVWQPERPGKDLLKEMLPVLLATGLTVVALLFYVIRGLLRVSGRLQASETQAIKDVEALKQARKEAEAADRAKINFMSVVSHELRTPLTCILGYARLGKHLRQSPDAKRLEGMLQQQDTDTKLAQSHLSQLLQSSTTGMEKIERSGEHLLFLVNQLLDHAKMETGSLELNPEICDVKEVLEPVVDQMKILTEQKGLELKADIPSIQMVADVIRTRQIIINLMGNAIKFTDSGKVSVVVTEVEDKVNIQISDTGTGIESHELQRIFEAFHQADLSSSRSSAGTGLGLSVARELARLESGTIDVHSEVGVGSVFTLSLPRQSSHSRKEAA